MKYRLLFLFALVLVMIQGQAAVIISSAETLDFGEVEVGYPVTTSFTVTSTNLNDNINLAVTGRKSSYYQVTPTTITPEKAAAGVKVTVKCSPSSQYISPASVTLTSQGAEDVVIPIAVSPFYPAELFLNNHTEEFTAKVGQIVTRTGTIRFADAEVPHDPNTPVVMLGGNDMLSIAPNGGLIVDGYSLAIEGADSNNFSASFVKSSAITNICTIAINYVPRSIGSHEATLKVYCSKAGVPLVTVNLRGEANDVLGDFDGDGVLDISDVTSMINLVLTDGNHSPRGDFDGDGKCDIADVTDFINYLLNW